MSICRHTFLCSPLCLLHVSPRVELYYRRVREARTERVFERDRLTAMVLLVSSSDSRMRKSSTPEGICSAGKPGSEKLMAFSCWKCGCSFLHWACAPVNFPLPPIFTAHVSAHEDRAQCVRHFVGERGARTDSRYPAGFAMSCCDPQASKRRCH